MRFPRLPLYVQVIIGVILGSLLGVIFQKEPIAFGFGNEELGALGLLVIRLLKALAVPLVLFAILDAFVKTRISARSGLKLVVICLINVTVAFAIGLSAICTILYEGLPIAVLFQQMMSGMNIFSFLAIPFFVFSGELPWPFVT